MKKLNKFLIFYTSLYFIVATTKILSFWKPSDFYSSDIESGKGFLTLIGCLTLIFAIYNMSKKTEIVIHIFKKSYPLLLLFTYIFISLFWSNLFSLSFKRFLKLLIILICIIDLVTENDKGKSLKLSLFCYSVFILYSSLFIIFVFPQYGKMLYQGVLVPKGIFGHKNSLGDFCASIILMFLWLKQDKKFIRLYIFLNITIFLSFLVILSSQSKNSLVSLSLSLILFFILNKYNAKGLLNLSLIFYCISILLFFYVFTLFLHIDFYKIFDEFIISLGKDLTFTGRTTLWYDLLTVGLRNNKLLGTGYGSFFAGEKSNALLNFINWRAPTAHCGYLQIFLELGCIGLIIFILYVVHTFFNVLKLNNSKEQKIMLSILLFNLIFNIMESVCLSYYFSFILFLSVSLQASNKRKI